MCAVELQHASHQAAVKKLLDATKPDFFLPAQADFDFLIACHPYPV